jgi:TPR repeat protein
MHERGFGAVEPDIKQAIEFYKVAASCNHVYSIRRLATFFFIGEPL